MVGTSNQSVPEMAIEISNPQLLPIQLEINVAIHFQYAIDSLEHLGTSLF